MNVLMRKMAFGFSLIALLGVGTNARSDGSKDGAFTKDEVERAIQQGLDNGTIKQHEVEIRDGKLRMKSISVHYDSSSNPLVPASANPEPVPHPDPAAFKPEEAALQDHAQKLFKQCPPGANGSDCFTVNADLLKHTTYELRRCLDKYKDNLADPRVGVECLQAPVKTIYPSYINAAFDKFRRFISPEAIKFCRERIPLKFAAGSKDEISPQSLRDLVSCESDEMDQKVTGKALKEMNRLRNELTARFDQRRLYKIACNQINATIGKDFEPLDCPSYNKIPDAPKTYDPNYAAKFNGEESPAEVTAALGKKKTDAPSNRKEKAKERAAEARKAEQACPARDLINSSYNCMGNASESIDPITGVTESCLGKYACKDLPLFPGFSTMPTVAMAHASGIKLAMHSELSRRKKSLGLRAIRSLFLRASAGIATEALDCSDPLGKIPSTFKRRLASCSPLSGIGGGDAAKVIDDVTQDEDVKNHLTSICEKRGRSNAESIATANKELAAEAKRLRTQLCAMTYLKKFPTPTGGEALLPADLKKFEEEMAENSACRGIMKEAIDHISNVAYLGQKDLEHFIDGERREKAIAALKDRYACDVNAADPRIAALDNPIRYGWIEKGQSAPTFRESKAYEDFNEAVNKVCDGSLSLPELEKFVGNQVSNDYVVKTAEGGLDRNPMAPILACTEKQVGPGIGTKILDGVEKLCTVATMASAPVGAYTAVVAGPIAGAAVGFVIDAGCAIGGGVYDQHKYNKAEGSKSMRRAFGNAISCELAASLAKAENELHDILGDSLGEKHLKSLGQLGLAGFNAWAAVKAWKQGATAGESAKDASARLDRVIAEARAVHSGNASSIVAGTRFPPATLRKFPELRETESAAKFRTRLEAMRKAGQTDEAYKLEQEFKTVVDNTRSELKLAIDPVTKQPKYDMTAINKLGVELEDDAVIALGRYDDMLVAAEKEAVGNEFQLARLRKDRKELMEDVSNAWTRCMRERGIGGIPRSRAG